MESSDRVDKIMVTDHSRIGEKLPTRELALEECFSA